MFRYFSAAFILLCISFSSCQDLQVSITPSVQTGDREGRDLTLMCQVQNLNNRIVEWIKGSMPITPNPQKYGMTANSTTGMFSLSILNLTRNVDSDTYYCAVFNSQSDVPLMFVERKGVRVNVFYFPDPGNPVCSDQTVIQEGRSQTFRCQSQPGEPVVVHEWRRDIGIVNTDDINTLNELQNGLEISFYTFVPSRSDTGDNVTCEICSTAFSQISSCTIGPLVVNYPPSNVAITERPFSSDNITYINSLLCAATASPSDISYGWSFSSSLDSSQVLITDYHQTLVILDDISCETEIKASCTATNQVGRSTADFILCTPPPPTTTIPPPTTTTMPPTPPFDLTDSQPAGSQFPKMISTPAPTVGNSNSSSSIHPVVYSIIGGIVMLLIMILVIAARRLISKRVRQQDTASSPPSQGQSDTVELTSNPRVYNGIYETRIQGASAGNLIEGYAEVTFDYGVF